MIEVRIVRIDRDFAAVCRGGKGAPWQRFTGSCWNRHRTYYEALRSQALAPLWPNTPPERLFEQRWRPACLKLTAGAWPRPAPRDLVEATIADAQRRCIDALARGDHDVAGLGSVEHVRPAPPWLPPGGFDVYVGFGFGVAPASSLLVEGRPAIALHFEHSQCRRELLQTMVAHEFGHCARAAALDLSLSPAELTLAEMVAYEGTATCFADAVLGEDTLAPMMTESDRRWHEQHEQAVRDAFARERDASGMATALRWFAAGGRPSGYWLGARMCAAWLAKEGKSLARLLAAPAGQLLTATDDLPGGG